MTEQIAIRLDDALAEHARNEAAAAGTNLADWGRTAIRQQVQLATAMRARAEEDARPPLYSGTQEEALMDARERRAVAAFDRPDTTPDVDTGLRG